MGPSAYTGTPRILYDDLNRLIEFRVSMVPSVIVLGQYTYDAFGRRVKKVTSSATTLYFYDSSGHLIEEQIVSSVPVKKRDFVWIEDEPVGIVDSASQPVKFSWIHTDRFDNPIAVTSSPSSGSAQVVWRASYQPFGQASVNQDPDADSQVFVLDMRLPGQLRDAETGLHYNWHRYYDPSIGRFISADPVGQQYEYSSPTLELALNLTEDFLFDTTNINHAYNYVDNSPLSWVDPHGLIKGKNRERPPNPNRRKGAENRQKTGDRQKNVGHPDGEEHSRVPKGKGGRGIVPPPPSRFQALLEDLGNDTARFCSRNPNACAAIGATAATLGTCAVLATTPFGVFD